MNKTGETDDGATKLLQICVSNKHQHSLTFTFENHTFVLTFQLLDEDKVKLLRLLNENTLMWVKLRTNAQLWFIKGNSKQSQRFRYCLEAEYSCARLSVIMWQRNVSMNPIRSKHWSCSSSVTLDLWLEEKTQSFGCSRQKHWEQQVSLLLFHFLSQTHKQAAVSSCWTNSLRLEGSEFIWNFTWSFWLEAEQICNDWLIKN